MSDEIWMWPIPKPGEEVPDFPPTDLTDAVASVDLTPRPSPGVGTDPVTQAEEEA